jgi:hypothetical protein
MKGTLKPWTSRLASCLAPLVVTAWTAVSCQQPDPVNVLTDGEVRAGWALLFDGKTLNGWRGFKRSDIPAGWRVDDGALALEPGVESGDLVTVEEFSDFELRLQWKISPNGNSGIFFRVSEDADRTWESAAEMQVLDNDGHPDGRNPLTSAGANYALHAPTADATRPVGSWNDVRLIVRGSQVEHWLNGQKVVEYELWTDQWKSMVTATKFAETPLYGLGKRGHLALQDHGNRVWFRDIKIQIR